MPDRFPPSQDESRRGPVSVQSREERLRILDEYAELDIEQQLRDGAGGRWDDLGREF